jgi:hypothetical protein
MSKETSIVTVYSVLWNSRSVIKPTTKNWDLYIEHSSQMIVCTCVHFMQKDSNLSIDRSQRKLKLLQNILKCLLIISSVLCSPAKSIVSSNSFRLLVIFLFLLIVNPSHLITQNLNDIRWISPHNSQMKGKGHISEYMQSACNHCIRVVSFINDTFS